MQAIAQLNELAIQFDRQLEEVDRKLEELDRSRREWVSPEEMAEFFNIAPRTLAKWRECKEWSDNSIPWISGIHYKQLPSSERKQQVGDRARSTTGYLYNKPLLTHWFNVLGSPLLQTRAAEEWQKKQRNFKKAG